ncbi:MAG: D-amino-acid transaminase [Rhodospirillaceae bacterium]|jgi:D-alanine transaminase|nr:D-amino-acid transaminase [Rhodospirillaceae bacterium]
MSRIAYVNGSYVLQSDAAVNVEDRGYQLADGVYEVIAVCDRGLVDCDAHMDRLQRSLASMRITPPSSRANIVRVMERIVRRNHIRAGLIYLQVTRGVAPRNHAFPTDEVESSLVITGKHRPAPSEEAVARGARIITLLDTRWSRPDIKTISLLPNVLAKQQAVEAGAFETWFTDEKGLVTEGSSTNAWIVTDGQEIVTRPLGQELLAGITRQTVLTVARANNLRVTERAFSVSEAKMAKEAFLTSTTAFVMPVVSIDDTPVNTGEPGSVTLQLLDAYRRHIALNR